LLLAAMLVAPLLSDCASGTPPPSSSSAAAVTISSASGETLAYDPAEATVRATGPIAITFTNRSSLAHNLVFTGGLTGGTRTIVEPGASADVVVGPAAPGRYPFGCTIHEGMRGTLIVLDGAASRVGSGVAN
jgi:plastocyanin